MKEGRQLLQRPPEYPVPMAAVQSQGEINVRDYLYVLYRRRWLALTFFTLVVFTVLLVVFLKKPVYRATATLKVEQETSPVLNFKDVYQTQKDDFNFLKTQYRILKSRSVAKRAVRALRLDGDPEFTNSFSNVNADSKSPIRGRIELSGDLGGDIKPSVIDHFLRRLTVTPVHNSWIVLVSFDDKNPARAAQAVNEIARQYIGFNIESKLNASQMTRDWLENHLDDMKAKLERSEEALNKYAARNDILLASIDAQDKNNQNGSSGQDLQTSRLEQISEQLVRATADRINKEALYNQAKSSGAGAGAFVMNNQLLQDLARQYSSLEAKYANLSAIYNPKYPALMQLKDQMAQLSERISKETAREVAAMRADYEAARQREEVLAQTYEQYKEKAMDLNNKMVQYNILKREADTNQQLYNGLLQRMKEIGVSASLNASNIQILDQAEAPRKPFAPKKARDILVSIIAGLLGGVGLAFGVDYIDNTLKNPEDIENSISLPCLGLVPAIETVPAGKRLLAWSEEEHAPILLEAYSAINTFIQFSSGSQAPKLMMVTSPLKGDGKTMTSVNLAATMARTRGRGLIVDSDLRNPQLHKIFDMDNSKGFSDYLAGMMHVEDGLVRKSGLENLDIITSGPRSPNPPDLFNSPKLADLLRKLGPEYEFILFDSPPVIGFSESLILSTSVEGVIMVVRTGRTTREAALQSRRAIESINSRVLGVVLNAIRQVDLKYSSYYHYGDYYYYSDDEKKASRKKQKAKNAIEN